MSSPNQNTQSQSQPNSRAPAQLPNQHHQPQQQQQPQAPAPTKSLFNALSRNNSNLSSTSSSNKGDFSSTISTTNSIASSRSQLSKQHQQLIDHRQLLATCAAVSSTPIRSFQRATISSVVKTRAFDNNPLLQGLLVPQSPGRNSVSNSKTPSPLSTPCFSRSRSLRMSGGPSRYPHHSPSAHQYHQHHQYHSTATRIASRTPDFYSSTSFNNNSYPCDTTQQQSIGALDASASHAKLLELDHERAELKESLEFLECERQVLMDSTKELKDNLNDERAQWKKEIDELKKQITDLIAARAKAESLLTRTEIEMNDFRLQNKKLNEELMLKDKHLEALNKDITCIKIQYRELNAINNELKHMLTEKLRYNGLSSVDSINSNNHSQISDCMSIVTELAKLRLQLNEKERLIDNLKGSSTEHSTMTASKDLTTLHKESIACNEIDTLNKFLDRTVECIKSWPEELAGSNHVQNLMKTLLESYKADHSNLTLDMENLAI